MSACVNVHDFCPTHFLRTSAIVVFCVVQTWPLVSGVWFATWPQHTAVTLGNVQPTNRLTSNIVAAYEAARGAGVEGVRAAGERQAPVGEEH